MITYEITGKRPEPGVPRMSQDTITEQIDAVNHNIAVKKYLEKNPGYVIVTVFPVGR